MSPSLTVLIPTWNRSRHILPSLRSVLAQDDVDFEVILCGDGCDDDTADVVRPFLGPRVRWINLPRNTGSQAYANNEGLKQARGELIAYLGHDDIWAPWHLREARRVLADPAIDVAVAGGFFQGPPGSHHLMVTGLFDDREADRVPFTHFLPPPSLVHRREAGRRVGGWGRPEELSLQADRDFQLRLAASGSRFRSTGVVSLHKFAASDRYLFYLHPDSQEQETMLARFARRGHARWLQRMINGARRAGNFHSLLQEAPSEPGELWRRSRRVRGHLQAELKPLGEGVEMVQETGPRALDWYGLEQQRFCWSGPSPRPRLLLPVRHAGRAEVEIEIAHARPGFFADFSLQVNGQPVAHVRTPGILRFVAELKANAASVVQFHAPTRPAESFSKFPDRRRLGFAIGRIRIKPVLE